MKIKKTHILLIMISLLLLVSIGSVCASEVSADTPLQATDDGFDEVVADPTDEGSNENPTQELINTTVISESKDLGYDDNKEVSVVVKDNETQNIDINESNITVFEGKTSLNFKYNNSIITITDILTVGEHNLTINYLGNSIYAKSSTNITLGVYGNKTLIVPETIVSDGTNVEIHVDVFDGLKYRTIEDEDKIQLNLTYIDENGNVSSRLIDVFTLNNNTIRFAVNDVSLFKSNLTVNYTEAVEPKTARIILTTRIDLNAEPRIRDTEDKNITVNVYDGKNNKVNVTKSDLKIFDNGKEITNFKLNESVITITSLAIGEHNLTIKFNKANYNASSKDIAIKVWGNETFNPQATANIDSSKNVNITLNLSDGVDPVNVDKSKLNITLFYTVGGETFNRTVTLDKITLLDDNQTIGFGVDETFDSAYVDIKYSAKENNLTAKTTIKVGADIIVPASMEEPAGKVIDFIVNVHSADGTLINVNASSIKVYSEGKEIKFTYNDSIITLNDTFKFGNYNITVKYLGNDTYSEVSKSFILTVYGINATSKTNVNSTKEGNIKLNIVNGNETVDIIADELTLNVTYKDGNKTIVIPVSSYRLDNGTLYFTLENANFTSATLNIKYNDTETNVTLNRIYNAMIQIINIENEYLSGNFTFKLVDIDDNYKGIANRTVTLKTDETFTKTIGTITSSNPISQSATSDSEGIINFKNSNLRPLFYSFEDNVFTYVWGDCLKVGLHNITLTSSDSMIKFNETFKTALVIDKLNITITPKKYSEYYGVNGEFQVVVTNSRTGEKLSGVILKFTSSKLTGTYYLSTNNEGLAKISGLGSLICGEYPVELSNNDTENINNKSASTSITIKYIPVTIDTKNVKIYYNSGTTSTIKIIDKRTNKAIANAYVTFKVDSVTYAGITNSKGIVSFAASLNVGQHKLTVISVRQVEDNYLKDIYQYSQVTRTINVVKASATIKAPKVTAYYKSGKYLTVTLINSKTKKPIFNAKMKIKLIVGKKQITYTGSTGGNGQLRLAVELAPGTYNVQVSGGDAKNFAAKTVASKIVVKKAPTKLIPKKLTAKKGKNTYFKVIVKNTKTKKVITGVKVKIKVYTGKKAKTYAVKTNSKGIAQLNVKSLTVGRHNVIVTSGNSYCVAKAAKSLITIRR